MIPDATANEIRERARADIAAIIGEHLGDLRRSGSRYTARCPFHDDNTPSLSINPEGFFHCFGCDAGGDTIAFLMEYHHESFPAVMQMLATRFHIDISVDGEQDTRERLKAANAAAAEYFGRNLRTMTEAEPARALLTERGFDLDDAITRFGCGYAPDGFNTTLNHLRKAGFSAHELTAAGLAGISRNGGKPYSFFRNRLTWTIRSSFGAPIGFGARKLDPNDTGGKYINSPETELYKKSQALYGLSTARDTMKKTGHVNIVEGYTDVMAMHVAGVTNTVAACGTALGLDHLKLLGVVVGEHGEITTAMDDDEAGHKSVLNIYETAYAAGLRQRLTVLPPTRGMDPDDYRRAYGNDALAELASRPRPIIETIIDRTLASAPRDSIEDRRGALDQVQRYLTHVKDPVVRGEYTRRVSQDLGFISQEVEGVLGPIPVDSAGGPSTATRPGPQTQAAPPKASHALERDILAALITDETLTRTHLDAAQDAFTANASQLMLTAITTALESSGKWESRLLSACGEDQRAQQATYALLAMPLPVHPDHIATHVAELFAALDRAQCDETVADLRHKLQHVSTAEEEAQLLGWIMQLTDGNSR